MTVHANFGQFWPMRHNSYLRNKSDKKVNFEPTMDEATKIWAMKSSNLTIREIEISPKKIPNRQNLQGLARL